MQQFAPAPSGNEGNYGLDSAFHVCLGHDYESIPRAVIEMKEWEQMEYFFPVINEKNSSQWDVLSSSVSTAETNIHSFVSPPRISQIYHFQPYIFSLFNLFSPLCICSLPSSSPPSVFFIILPPAPCSHPLIHGRSAETAPTADSRLTPRDFHALT